ncbi:probable cyclic nucleotide-gated ion channel 20, chloroplastic isoform X2 [Ziziphus jujuba]|uniref:Probable cyclic nucleotide-gated ion channel 20, chloroplastic isoform X2 n=1 Tax=Ziziphus jujuba TaxID=326968 RepID=A0ABM3ZZT3_ZIZJJ|nr:probable cyclic nucleotide-gated ion channel 20, chloroplastic isoform X2 [Ziziphus jujuba]
MAAYEKDEMPMLSDNHTRSSNDNVKSPFERFGRTQSASYAISMNSTESYASEPNLVGHTGPLRSQRTPFIPMSGPLNVCQPNNLLRPSRGVAVKKEAESRVEKVPATNGTNQNDWPNYSFAGKNEHLLRSGQLGMCNDPYCTTCPTHLSHYHYNGAKQRYLKASGVFNSQFHNAFYGDAKGWARRIFSFMSPYIPGVMNPHARVIQKWNKFFVIACFVANFMDPLFFFLLSVRRDHKCIVINWPIATVMVIFRSLYDIVYLLHILLQFKLAYVEPESKVVGAGELVDLPTKIARHYLQGYFLLDFFNVLPLPQIVLLLIVPKYLGLSSGANYAKNLLRAAILAQYVPRLCRFLPLLAGQSPSGFTFEAAWANIIINLLTFVLSGHVIGSCWYLFGLQRVNQCLRNACHDSQINSCMEFLDCGYGDNVEGFNKSYPTMWTNWTDNINANSCFSTNGFTYGIYNQAVNLTTERSFITRYVYSLFWGFQQISTLAGNQTPSHFVWEVLFTLLGLLLFALVIGNMQNFLQDLGKRRLEMSLRRCDVEQWMSHRRLPEELRRRVRQAEWYNWAATRGVNEEILLKNLPEDLQRDIRCHLFMFIKKVSFKMSGSDIFPYG